MKSSAQPAEKTARAFAPANISLIFETYRGDSIEETGSLGVGATLERGVIAEVRRLTDGNSKSKISNVKSVSVETVIRVNGDTWEFPTARAVAGALAPEPVLIEIEAAFPFGCGFGMSGASALAVAYAVNALFELGKSERELAMAAHVAEVEQSTGLGDVGGQFNGGLMMKTKRFDPLAVEPVSSEPIDVYVRVFGPILTSEVITSKKQLAEINEAGSAAILTLLENPNPSFESLLRLSRTFAVASGLLQSEKVSEAIAAAEKVGGAASMIMLGEAVVSSVPFPGAEPARIVNHGVRLLDGDTEEEKDDDEVPTSHPRHLSLTLRNRIVAGVERGVTSIHGLIAHGRGEAYDYLLGERTHPFAETAIAEAARMLRSAKHPVLSINGNVCALVPEQMIRLAGLLDAPLEINIFHASKERERAMRAMLEEHGAATILMPSRTHAIDHLDHNRKWVHPDGIHKADVVLVPLEDGDRCQALVANGKQVITVDLNPLSRTARTASVTIVDNLVRCIPLLCDALEVGGAPLVKPYDHEAVLAAAERAIRKK